MNELLYEDQFDYRIPTRKEEELTEELTRAAHFMEALLDKFYSTNPLDLLETENHMDELCYCLGIIPRKGDLKIARHNT